VICHSQYIGAVSTISGVSDMTSVISDHCGLSMRNSSYTNSYCRSGEVIHHLVLCILVSSLPPFYSSLLFFLWQYLVASFVPSNTLFVRYRPLYSKITNDFFVSLSSRAYLHHQLQKYLPSTALHELPRGTLK